MPAIGSDFVFQVRFTYVNDGITAQNVYYYRQTGGANPDAAINVGNAVASALQPSQRVLMNIATEFTLVECQQLGSVTNYAEIPLSSVFGFQVGQVLPSFVACPITLRRTTKETRNGSKRLAFFTEDNINGNSFDTDIRDEIDAIAAAMAANVTSGAFTLQPVIVGGLYDTSVTPKVLRPVAEWVYNLISGADSSYIATSQNSRKFGVGI